MELSTIQSLTNGRKSPEEVQHIFESCLRRIAHLDEFLQIKQTSIAVLSREIEFARKELADTREQIEHLLTYQPWATL